MGVLVNDQKRPQSGTSIPGALEGGKQKGLPMTIPHLPHGDCSMDLLSEDRRIQSTQSTRISGPMRELVVLLGSVAD